MKRLSACGLLALAGLLGSFVWAQETKGISWKHGLSFQVREPGQNAFTKETPKVGTEVFLDKDVGQLLYIAEKEGSVGLGTSAKLAEGAEVKAPLLYHALEVRVRPKDVKDFNDTARKFSAEVFKDVNADNLVYVSNKKWIAVTPAAGIAAPDKIKDPLWFHGLELKVRKAGEKEFTDSTKKVSLEVYKDDNTNHLLYVTDEGVIAVVPAAGATKQADVKGPAWYHAFEIKARKAKEEKFSADTRAYGVEVYKDENANTLIYISETGAIAVVPAGGVSKPASSKEPKFLYGRSFRVRNADDKDFNDKTPAFGAEVYKDENTGNLVYICETGALTVTTGK